MPRIVVALSLLGLMVALWVVPFAYGAEEKTLTVTDADNGKTVAAGDATKVVIRLAGNATTGFAWAVAKVDGTALEQVGQVEYQPDAAKSGGGRVGAGGVFIVTFRAVKEGRTTVTLEYRRPWEKNTAAAKVFTVTVQVQGDAPATQPG